MLQAQKRNIVGKQISKLRKEGFLPAVMYGAGHGSRSLSVHLPEFLKIWKNAGESTIIDLKVEDESARNVVIHDVALDPVLSHPLHVDFLEVASDKLLKTHVPIEFAGEAEAVKSLGGVLVRVMYELEVEALPKNLPHAIRIDVAKLATFDDKIFLGDVVAPAGVKICGDQDALIAKVDQPRAEEEIETPEVNLESIEVAKRGKKEESPEEKEPDETSS